MEGNLGAAYQLYLNSMIKSQRSSFDEWVKQNYCFTNVQKVNLSCLQQKQFQVEHVARLQGHQEKQETHKKIQARRQILMNCQHQKKRNEDVGLNHKQRH